ncbi:alpha-L-arabinofuranosidase C-terminal domain-containing protein [candidate division KSB1 bacterium]
MNILPFKRKIHYMILLISLTVLMISCSKNGQMDAGRIPNTSFEEMDENKPAGWSEYRFGGRPQLVYADSGKTGTKSVMISSERGADGAWGVIIPVKPYSNYRLSGWIKTEDVEVNRGGRGALFNLHTVSNAQTEALTGTNDWTQVEMEFNTDRIDAVQINCLFGGWGRATGKAWFDDVELELISTKELNPTVTINTDLTKEPISKYIYGQFIEHLGRCIYGGIWAEMIEDRKFYYGFSNSQTPWEIIGDSLNITLNSENSFVGDQTPQIILKGDGSVSGLYQENLGIIKDMGYDGRIVLSGDAEAATVEVSLVWGSNENDRETVIIKDLTEDYRTVPLRFTAKKSTDQGGIEIISRGKGSFNIGTISLMPENNIEGIRPDVLELLKELDAPVYRWPGGNFVSGYDWKDGIGDPDKRPPRKNPAWRGVEHNDVGVHEFIRLCRLIDTEPYVTVNTGLGTIEMAVEELEYCNGSSETPMGRLRAENGHPEPFDVTWWAIGNEMYGNWQLGNMPVEEYVRKHNRVVDAMRAIDPDIIVVGVGSVGRWDRAVLGGSSDHMDYISEHFYCQERPGIMAHVAQAPGHVKRISNAVREYHDSIPELSGKEVRIAMDEWNYWYGPHIYGELGTRYFLKDALGIASGFHEFFRNSDIVYMANYAQTVNVIGCIKTTKTEAAFATTGLVLKLYRQHYGTIPVEIGGTPEPLDVVAAWTEDKTRLIVGIVNPTNEKYELPIAVSGTSFADEGIIRLITGDAMDYNEPGKKPVVTIQEKSVKLSSGKLKVPPVSISLYEFPVIK